MKTKKKFTLKKIAVLSLISATMIYAFTEHSSSLMKNPSQRSLGDSYKSMTTAELEKVVEQHSRNGELPFDMGIELIKRWTAQ